MTHQNLKNKFTLYKKGLQIINFKFEKNCIIIYFCEQKNKQGNFSNDHLFNLCELNDLKNDCVFYKETFNNVEIIDSCNLEMLSSTKYNKLIDDCSLIVDHESFSELPNIYKYTFLIFDKKKKKTNEIQYIGLLVFSFDNYNLEVLNDSELEILDSNPAIKEV